MQKIRTEMPWLTDGCLDKIRWGGIGALKDNEDCTRRLPPARWSGLWRNDFEASLFCPAPAPQCPGDARGDRIWFELEPRPAAVRNTIPGGLYAVDFIGRRSARGSPHEAWGFTQDIVVDRLISIKEVEPPPKE
jgi:hypothetical protein